MRVFTNPNTPIPEVHLLSNGRYHVMVSAAGGGYSRWNDLAITRWREDPTSESFGVFCFIGDPLTHRCWSNSFQPTLRAGRHYEAVFTPGRAEFRRQDDQVETHTEIAVSTEDDLEIRRIRLTNRSQTARSLLVTSYAEVVLAPGVTDELHRAFSNLFVHAELVPDHSAILMTRRPRSAEEQPPWMFCMMLAAGDEVGACSYETDRARFIGRGRSARQPAALDDWGPLSGTAGPVLDPCVALRRTVELAVDGSAQLDLIIGAAPTREAAMALVSKYQDHRMADRVFEVAATHSRAVLGHLGASEAEAQHYGQLASAVIFPVGAYRAPEQHPAAQPQGPVGAVGVRDLGRPPDRAAARERRRQPAPGARPAQGARLLADAGPADRPGDLERGRLGLPARAQRPDPGAHRRRHRGPAGGQAGRRVRAARRQLPRGGPRAAAGGGADRHPGCRWSSRAAAGALAAGHAAVAGRRCWPPRARRPRRTGRRRTDRRRETT